MDPDIAASRLMARQHSLITFEQARQCGLTLAQIRYRLRTGRWVLVTRGAYRAAAAPESWRQRALAAALAGPKGAVASHLTAAALHGLWTPPARPHITVPPGASARRSIARVHRSRLAVQDRISVDGVRATTPARTLADCAAVLSPAELAGLVDNAFCQGLTAVRPVREAVERAQRSPGRKGLPLLLSLVETWTSGIEPGSPAEMRLLRRLEEWGYPIPVRQFEVRDASGRLVAVPDLAWPHVQVGLEYDSDRWHGPRRWEHDESRLDSLRALGWTIRRVGKGDLLPSQTWLCDELDRLVGRAAA